MEEHVHVICRSHLVHVLPFFDLTAARSPRLGFDSELLDASAVVMNSELMGRERAPPEDAPLLLVLVVAERAVAPRVVPMTPVEMAAGRYVLSCVVIIEQPALQ